MKRATSVRPEVQSIFSAVCMRGSLERWVHKKVMARFRDLTTTELRAELYRSLWDHAWDQGWMELGFKLEEQLVEQLKRGKL